MLVDVRGWVMLAGVSAGRYRIEDLKDGTIAFYRPKGTKQIARHYADNVSVWVRDTGSCDLNGIFKV